VYIDSRQVVRSNRDSETAGGWYYVVRTARVPSTLVPQIRAAIAGIDPQATASSIATMDEILSNAVVSPRFYATLLGVFASVAVLLSAVGIYGVVAYTVSRRTREIGIRIALGARRHAVLRLMLGQILLVVAAGLCIGLAGAALFARSLDTMLFGLTPVDPVTFVLAPVSFAVVAAVAAFIPSRRATRIDPQTALRCE
jgi:putative ABC transport system permease protein